MDFFKKPVIIIIIVVAIIGALLWSYISQVIKNRQTQQSTGENNQQVVIDLTNIDPAEFDEPIKNQLATATAKAVESDPKNQLAAVVVELPPTLAVNSGNARYVFVSDKDKFNNFTITFSLETDNFLRARIPKEDYLGDLHVMDTKLWKFNYVTAFQITEKEGGKEWRSNNELKSITETLRHGEPNNWLTWTVEYQGINNVFSKKIDANSGKVVETE